MHQCVLYNPKYGSFIDELTTVDIHQTVIRQCTNNSKWHKTEMYKFVQNIYESKKLLTCIYILVVNSICFV